MLYLVATPIGNLEDITLRALRVLNEVDFILAEDTRKTGLLLKHFKISKPLKPLFEHNEIKAIPQIIKELTSGKTIAIVSSAGTPTISDPGYKLIRECRKNKIPLTALCGASSVINAVSLSAIPRDKFIFCGYWPRKISQQKKILEKAKDFAAAIVFLESPFRIVKSLEAIKETNQDCQVSLCREMTKKFEEVIEGDVSEVLKRLNKTNLKGEFTVVVSLKDS